MDFYRTDIEITPGTSAWGPYRFSLENKLPDGVSVTGATVRSFAGRVDPGDDLDEAHETTSMVINSSTVEHPYVYVYFDHDPDAAGDHTVVLDIETDSGGSYAFYFYRVRVF